MNCYCQRQKDAPDPVSSAFDKRLQSACCGFLTPKIPKLTCIMGLLLSIVLQATTAVQSASCGFITPKISQFTCIIGYT